jgi:hypothetical protein
VNNAVKNNDSGDNLMKLGGNVPQKMKKMNFRDDGDGAR